MIRLIDRQFGDLLIEWQVVLRDLCVRVSASAAVTDDPGPRDHEDDEFGDDDQDQGCKNDGVVGVAEETDCRTGEGQNHEYRGHTGEGLDSEQVIASAGEAPSEVSPIIKRAFPVQKDLFIAGCDVSPGGSRPGIEVHTSQSAS